MGAHLVEKSAPKGQTKKKNDHRQNDIHKKQQFTSHPKC